MGLVEEDHTFHVKLRSMLPGPFPSQGPEWTRQIKEQVEMDQSTIGRTYEAAPRGVWTEDPPRDPGYYWIRIMRERPRVVEVYWHERHLVFAWTDIDPTEVEKSPDIEWGSRELALPMEKANGSTTKVQAA